MTNIITEEVSLHPQWLKKAKRRAKKDHANLSEVFNFFLERYANGEELILSRSDDTFTKEESEEILKASLEANGGINVSPRFSSAEEAIYYLRQST
ncbi:MAG: hypothetical protein WCJ84_06575 [Candidatus Peregrinibacteria bacterium]